MKKKRGYQPKPRNTHSREPKRVILLATEGYNKTETQYFRDIRSSTYTIKFASGNYTDPVNMIISLRKQYDARGYDPEMGDMAFCLIDSDVDPSKDRQMELADAETGNYIRLIVSSPCFEIWFLCHFTSSAKRYTSNNEVLKALQRYLPNYTKNMTGLWDKISERTDMAVSNAVQLENGCLERGLKRHTADFTPSTEIYLIMKELLNLKN